MGMYFDNSKKNSTSQSEIAKQLSFSTAAGTVGKSSKGASTFAAILCICSVLSLVLSGALALMLSMGAFISAGFGLPSAKRDKRLGVTGSGSQILILTFLALLSVVIFFAAMFVAAAGY